MKRFIRPVLFVLWILFLVLSLVFSLAERWLIKSWASMGADELIFHLGSSLKGANMEVVKELLFGYYLLGFIILSLILTAFFLAKKAFVKKLIVVLSIASALVLLLSSVYDLDKETGVVRRFFSEAAGIGDGEDFIRENYSDASTVTFEFPEEKRNLIYIYLESMEMTFSDTENGGSFEENLIPNLTGLSMEYEDFRGDSPILNGAYSLPSTDWTMAGMFAQSSGMPLKVAFKNNYMEHGFFPGLVTIGDLLQSEGYSQTLLIGSEAEFGGREDFYTAHGSFDIHDYNYAIDNGWIPEDYNVWWGFEDSKLFEFAQNDLLELSGRDDPFHYVILTADTHFEDGYVCELCGNEHGDNRYANVFSCSDRQVSGFILWLMQQDFWDNTTVVLCGDHTTMDSDFCDNVHAEYGRRTYTLIINGVAVPENPDMCRQYSTLDLFPTTLAALGVKMSSDRLGLGVNLYSDTRTIIEEYGLDMCRQKLEEKSEFMLELSGESVEAVSETLDEAIIRMTFTEEEDGEGLSLFMWGLGNLNHQYIDEIYVDVTDTRTGVTTRYIMEMDLTDPNPYCCNADTDFKTEDRPFLEAVGYICFNGMPPKEVTSITGEE